MQLRYTILITSSPYHYASNQIALNFCKALIHNKQIIEQIFFYNEGAYVGANLSICPQDETNLLHSWQDFLQQNKITGMLCVNSALKRGVIDETYGKTYGVNSTTINEN